MSVLMIDKNSFEAEVIKSEKTVLLDFFADWCGPCQMISPILHELADEREDVKVCKINVDAQPELAAAFGVESIPSLFVIKNGKVTNKALGYRTKDQLIDML